MDPNIQTEVPQTKSSSKYEIVAVLNLLSAIPQILVPIPILLFAILSLSSLYNTLNMGQTEIVKTYFYLIAMLFFGGVNLFFFLKLLKKTTINREVYFRYAIILAIGSFFLSAFFLINVFQSILRPVDNPTAGQPSQFKTSPSPTIDETANWKTYENLQVGISFKYPPNWFVEPFNIAGFSHPITSLKIEGEQYGPEPATLSITYWDNPEKMSLEKFEQKLNLQYRFFTLPNAQNATLGGVSGFYWKEIDCEPVICNRYIIPYKNKLYEIELFVATADKYKTILNQILSTFKFFE